jgi:hypothetical protein
MVGSGERTMKVRIISRYWNDDLKKKFGEEGSIHNLPDDTETFIREFAIPFGRFAIRSRNGELELEFQNDYD